MKVIIAGSRRLPLRYSMYNLIEDAVQESGWRFELDQVVSGGAPGIDLAGEGWAKEHGIPVKVFLADWDHHGLAAGPIRNTEMANYSDALVLVWDGKSRGSANMKVQAQNKGLKIFEKIVT